MGYHGVLFSGCWHCHWPFLRSRAPQTLKILMILSPLLFLVLDKSIRRHSFMNLIKHEHSSCQVSLNLDYLIHILISFDWVWGFLDSSHSRTVPAVKYSSVQKHKHKWELFYFFFTKLLFMLLRETYFYVIRWVFIVQV